MPIRLIADAIGIVIAAQAGILLIRVIAAQAGILLTRVIAAQAAIQRFVPMGSDASRRDPWIPAFAGMTEQRIQTFAGMTDCRIPAFAGMTANWIAACAAMTIMVLQVKRQGKRGRMT